MIDNAAQPPIRIRPGDPSDDRALAAIDHDSWSPEVSPSSQWPLETPFFDDVTLPHDVLVAVQSDAIVGYVKLRPVSFPASRHIQEINGFAVAREHLGRGIGRLLLDAARDEAISRSAHRITLRVLSTNTRAITLYKSCGYKIEGRLKRQFLIEDAYVDDVRMATDLNFG